MRAPGAPAADGSAPESSNIAWFVSPSSARQGKPGSARAERDDPAGRVVRGDADGDPVAGDDLDAEPAHPAAQLGQHLVAGIALHAVETAAVHCDDRALYVDEVVFCHVGS